MDTSGDPAFGRTVRQWIAGSDYTDARYLTADVAPAGVADADRRENKTAVQQAMTRIYNRMVADLGTEYALIVEDDVIPPADVVERLLRSMGTDVASVAAPYKSRFHAGYVVWGRDWRTFAKRGRGVERIGGNGFGCTLIRRSVFRHAAFTHAAETGDFDWNVYYWLARHAGGQFQALLDWSCEAAHD